MKDFSRTAIYIAVAAVLIILAVMLRPAPPSIERLSDEGEAFYPNFSDPLDATSLEVVKFDEEAGSAVPFKVEFSNGSWIIPSHYNYPADGKDRLANTAAAFIDLKKDIIQSDRAQDHESLGVIDPLDDSQTGVAGRGERVTLRGESGAVLADYIIGDPVPGREGFRYVRLPDKKRTYAVKVNADLSTKFADWINADLLELRDFDIMRIVLNDYNIDEATGSYNQVGRVTLSRDIAGKWTLAEAAPEKEVDETKVREMLSALDQLTITGVRPKPASLTADLRAAAGINIDMPTRLSLESRGFYISADGRLLSNEGEITIGTKEGVTYTLRFGEVLYGEGLDVTAGSDDETGQDEVANNSPGSGKENRYVFITAGFDESLLVAKPAPPTPRAPAVNENNNTQPAEGEGASDNAESTDENVAQPEQSESQAAPEVDPVEQYDYERKLADWQKIADTGREKAKALNDRFAEWYYVISGADFKALRPSVNDLVKQAEPQTNTPPAAPSVESDS